jgi:adenylate cyclase
MAGIRKLEVIPVAGSDLVDPIISVHHGRVVKRTGDGSIIEFRSVVDAMRCAVAVLNGALPLSTGLQ